LEEQEHKEREALAQALRQSADRYLSEQALRDALSRSYYSVFHLGCILLGRGYGNHEQFLKDLQGQLGTTDDLWRKMKRLQDLRIEADYRFDALKQIYGGNPTKFRDEAFDGLALGREVYGELAKLIRKRYNDGGDHRTRT